METPKFVTLLAISHSSDSRLERTVITVATDTINTYRDCGPDTVQIMFKNYEIGTYVGSRSKLDAVLGAVKMPSFEEANAKA